MVDNICNKLLMKIKKADETIDDEKAEIIYYGLQNIVGELPKGIIVLAVAAVLGVLELVLLGSVVMMIYRAFAGGVHLKTHVSCLFTTMFLIIGSTYLAKSVEFSNPSFIYTALAIVNLFIITLYAPADTENRPIMKESQKKRQKIECYVMLMIVYILSMVVIKNQIISSLFLYMMTVESLMITPLAYKMFDNKYGDERRKKIQNGV